MIKINPAKRKIKYPNDVMGMNIINQNFFKITNFEHLK